MKIKLSTLRHIIKEVLIVEATCPLCGSEGAYVGMNDVECANAGCEAYSERQAEEVHGKKDQDATSYSGEIDLSLPTDELVKAIEGFLRSKGFTGIQSGERWEGDGVMEISCNEGLKQSTSHQGKVGWTLSCAGGDLKHMFDLDGVEIHYVPDDPDYEASTTVKTWEKLNKVISYYQDNEDKWTMVPHS